MAFTFSSCSSILFVCMVTIFFFTTVSADNPEQFSETLLMGRTKKVSHLHFYFNVIVSGLNPTEVQIAVPKKATATGFGTTMIIDDALTEGPEPKSKIIGRVQGMYASAGLQEVSLLMNMNFVFMEGKYNGSTLSLFGWNPVGHAVREMPIIGGSGLFRFSRGYALAKTVWFHKNGDALIEYNVSVLHY